MRLRLSVVTAALLGGVAVSSAQPAAAAQADASFALKPVSYDPALAVTKSYFVFATRPGAVIANRVRIVNTGATTGTAYLYPVDATTGQTSGAVYLSRQSPRRDVGAWIRLSRSRVTLPPGASAVVDFDVRVPRSVRPGDHLGAIVAENATLTHSSGHGALQIRIRHLTIDAVELQLPGRVVAKADVTSVNPGGEHGYQYVYLRLRNSGTIMTKPVGSLLITNARGIVVARRSLQLDTFLPGTQIDYPVLLPRRALSAGKYTATVSLRSGDQRVAGYRESQGAPFGISRTFTFAVSAMEQTKVYSGTAPLIAPSSASAGKHGSGRSLLGTALIVLAVLLALGVALRLVLARRARRARQPVEPGATPASTATSEQEDDAPRPWSDLLLPYDAPSEKVIEEPWAGEAPGPEAVVEPEPDPVPEAVPDPESEPPADPDQTQQYEPTAAEIEELIRRHDSRRSRAPRRVDASGLESTLLTAVGLALLGMLAVRAYGGSD